MKRVSLLVLVALASAAVLLSASPVQSGRRDDGGGWHTYTFDEAVKAGIVPSLDEQLKESGLPLCPPPNVGTGGYKDPTALREAIAKAPEEPTCMADPRQATFSSCSSDCGDQHSSFGGLVGAKLATSRPAALPGLPL
jgi:hypothetical protein